MQFSSEAGLQGLKSYLNHSSRTKKCGQLARAASAIAAVLLAPAAYATTGTWNADASDVWSNSARWTGGIPTVAGDTASITANITATRTITIDGTVASRTVGTLNIGDSNNTNSYTLAASGGGTLTFDNGASNAVLQQVSTSASNTISAPLILNNSLDLTNAAASTTLTISGTLTSGNAGAKTITVAGTAAGPVTLSGVISDGSGSITLNKTNTANTLTLSAANTFSGGVTIAGGTLNLNSSGTGGTSSALGTGALTITGGTIASTAGSAVTLSTNNAQNWNSNFSFGGTQSLNLGTGAVTMSAARTITIAGSGTYTIGGVISDGGSGFSLTTANSGGATGPATGNFVLSGANTYTGGTIINGGTLRFNNASAVPATGTISIGSGGALGVTGAHTTLAGWLTDSRLNNTTAGALALTAASSENFDPGAAGFSTVSLGAAAGVTAAYTGTYTPQGGTNYFVGGGGGTINFSNTNAFTGARNVTVGNGGGGTVVVSGSNDYTGPTTVLAAATLQVGGGGTTGSIDSTSGIANAGIVSFNRTDPVTFIPVISGAGDLVKNGANTLTLAAAQTYTGDTFINQGTLTSTVAQTLSGSLTFGTANTTTSTGTFSLGSTDATFGGLLAQTNSTNTTTVNIPAGRTLTINGPVTIGTSASASTSTTLTGTGGGALILSNTATNGVTQIGGTTTATSVGNRAIADFSGLSSLTISLNTTNGTLRVNPSNGNNTDAKYSTLTLPSTGAGDSTITANSLNIGDSGQNNAAAGQVNTLLLGTGTNLLKVNTINVGTGSRDVGAIRFNTSAGALTIGNAAGNGAAAFNMGTGSANTGVAGDNEVDLRGHTLDVQLGVVTIGTQPRSNAQTETFSFDAGSVTMASLVLAQRTGTGSTTNGAGLARTTNAILNVGGGTLSITGGVTALGVNNTSSGNITGFVNTSNGTINISGGSVSIGASSGTAITMGGAVASSAGSGTLNITGGSATLSGNLVKSGGAGTTTAMLILDGGLLDMGGGGTPHNIGSGTAAIDTLTFASGELRNVAAINGTGGLTKTTTGTLALTGTNTYTGGTTINGGTLLANSAAATGSGAVTVNNTGTLGGTGSVSGAVTVNSGGTVAPGASIGTLSIANPLTMAPSGANGPAVLNTELKADGSRDLLALTAPGANGKLTIGAGDTLNLVPLDNITSQTGYTIATFSDLSGTFTNVLVNGQPTQSGDNSQPNYVSVTYLTGDGTTPGSGNIQISVNNLSAVPEPATAALLGLAAGGLLLRRRRRVRG